MSADVTPDPISEAAAKVLADQGLTDACGTGGSCDDCTFGCDDHDSATACGNDGGTATAEERMTIAASGVVIAFVALAIVATGGTPWHLALATVATAGGLALAAMGTIATLRGGVLGDRLLTRGAALLPYITGVLLIGIVFRAVTVAVALL